MTDLVVGAPVELAPLAVGSGVELQPLTLGEPVGLPVLQMLSADGSYYRHDQTVAATVWTVDHGLGRYPAAVSAFSADLETHFDHYVVQHMTLNQLRITSDYPVAGIALVS